MSISAASRAGAAGERGGRSAWRLTTGRIRAAVYGFGLMPAAWSFWLGATNSLGADPVRSFEDLLGLWTLRFLILGLLVTPLRKLAGVNLLRYRRALGLLAFWYAAMHFATYAILDRRLDLPVILADVTKRPFLVIGMAALLVLAALAATSNRISIRWLGRGWARLHRLVYLAVALGAVHFIMSVKSWPTEPLAYAAFVSVLLGYRLVAPLLPRGAPLRAQAWLGAARRMLRPGLAKEA